MTFLTFVIMFLTFVLNALSGVDLSPMKFAIDAGPHGNCVGVIWLTGAPTDATSLPCKHSHDPFEEPEI
jgi:hypothetical protein